MEQVKEFGRRSNPIQGPRLNESSLVTAPGAIPWFDAHLDLAYLAQQGRAMRQDAYAVIGEPAAVTFPALMQGNVRRVLGTIFIQRHVPGGAGGAEGPWCFDNADEAHAVAWRQVNIYQAWEQTGLCRLTHTGDKGDPRGRVAVTLLMEGAAGVREVEELRGFYDAGVRVLGLTWAEGTKWAGGNDSGGGLTADGKRLVAEMDKLQMVHDVSHLSEQAFWALLEVARGPAVASHSNCRALLEGREKNERNLTDQQIKSLVGRGGMIGINLFTNFLVVGRRAMIADVVRHVQRIVELTGRADVVGLGSDMDGGFGPSQLPVGLEHPRKLHRLAEALSAAGFSDDNVRGFAHDNWTRFFERVLPE